MSWWIPAQRAAPREYPAEHGEQRVVRLNDGSVLHINSDSNVRVFYTKTGPDIVMKHGQAPFEVSEDKARPLRVRDGDTQVVAVGTAFDVRRVGDDVLVTVVQGSVAETKLAMAAPGESGAAQDLVAPHPAVWEQARQSKAHEPVTCL